ncbi:MAG: endonuclease III [Actinomycetota bacterium]|nr:endonuclease III [Actinomycetota bacterium]
MTRLARRIKEPPSARRIRAVHRRLVQSYGPIEKQEKAPIVECLVGTVLSQHTSDINSGRAWRALKERWPSWDAFADASLDQIEDAIRPGGLARLKASRIRTILDEVLEREGRVDLSGLEALADAEVYAYLRSLPGVGPKTAACVMAFSMERDAFPIDTHVHRVVMRLGWVSAKTSAEAASRELESRIPSGLRYELHVAMIEHGRRTCRARRPLCSECPVFDFCKAGARLLADGSAV